MNTHPRAPYIHQFFTDMDLYLEQISSFFTARSIHDLTYISIPYTSMLFFHLLDFFSFRAKAFHFPRPAGRNVLVEALVCGLKWVFGGATDLWKEMLHEFPIRTQ